MYCFKIVDAFGVCMILECTSDSFESEAIVVEVQEKASKENKYTNKSFVTTQLSMPSICVLTGAGKGCFRCLH